MEAPAVTPRKLIFTTYLCPGDHTVFTATLRDLHVAHPGAYLTDIRSSTPDLFFNNPYVTALRDDEAEIVPLNYDWLIKRANQSAMHFLHGYRIMLERVLGVEIPLTKFAGDIWLSAEEMAMDRQVQGPYWIIISGVKNDFTCKGYDVSRWQAVVAHFMGRIAFAQVGEWNHFHPNLSGVIDLRGKTTLRQLILLVYHSEGVLCPVTSLMHLAAAVPTKNGHPRPCIVVAGSREPPTWERYPTHRFLDNVGHAQLPCSWTGGCWKSRVTKLNDGAPFDESICLYPEMAETAIVPRCLKLITARMVIDAVSSYL